MTGVTVKFIDKDNLQVAIRRASAPPNSRILSAVASRMRGMQMEHFKEQKDSAGKAWIGLKPGTIAARKRRRSAEAAARKLKAKGGKGVKKEKKIAEEKKKEKKKKTQTGAFVEKILQDRGRLKTSIVRYSDRNTAITGTNTIYAATHQFGREGGGWQGSDIPAREFIYLTEGEKKTLIEFVSKEIVGPLMKRKN